MPEQMHRRPEPSTHLTAWLLMCRPPSALHSRTMHNTHSGHWQSTHFGCIARPSKNAAALLFSTNLDKQPCRPCCSFAVQHGHDISLAVPAAALLFSTVMQSLLQLRCSAPSWINNLAVPAAALLFSRLCNHCCSFAVQHRPRYNLAVPAAALLFSTAHETVMQQRF